MSRCILVWVSCESSPNPNSDRGEGHWIMYDYAEVYSLGQMQVWNVNDPSHLDWGMREVEIYYSVDGVVWESAGTFLFEQNPGLNTYKGFDEPDFNEVEAQFLLITATSNWGGTCYGLSEVRIEAEEIVVSSVDDAQTNSCFKVVVMPNPFVESARVEVNTSCGYL